MWHSKPIYMSRTELDKNEAFYKKYEIPYNKWLYIDNMLIERYKIGLLTYVDKNLNIRFECVKLKELALCILDTSGNIHLVDTIHGIINVSTGNKFNISSLYGIRKDVLADYINSPFSYKKVQEEYELILGKYWYEIDQLINSANNFRNELIVQENLYKKNHYEVQNTVAISYGNKGAYKLKFYSDHIEMDSISYSDGRKMQVVKSKSLDKLIELLDNNLRIYGFEFKNNIDIILDDCGLLMSASSILKLILILTDNIGIKQYNLHITSAEPIKNLKLPLNISLTRLNTELNKIVCGETTKCTLPSKLRRYPFLKDVPYIGDVASAYFEGDYLRVHTYLKPTYFSNKDDLAKAIRKDIKNIMKESFRCINSRYISIHGEMAPLNMYKPQSYKIINGTELLITFKLKISSYEIEKDALDLIGGYR